jgi:hypothetical protein
MKEFLALDWIHIIPKILLSGAVVLGLVITCVISLIIIRRLFRVTVKREHTLRLINEGNVRSVFRLSFESTRPDLTFQLFVNDIPLAVVIQPAPVVRPVEAQKVQSGTEQRQANQKQKSTSPQTTQGGGNPVQGINKSGKAVADKTGTAASILGTLGGLIPGSAGKALKEQAAAARNVQMKTNETMRMPEQTLQRVDSLNRSSSKMGLETPKFALPDSHLPAPGSQQPVLNSVTPTTQPFQSPLSKTLDRYTVQTPEIGPGETILLNLRIGSKQRRVPEGSFLYLIRSQQVPIERQFKEPAPYLKQGIVHFDPVQTWHYWMPGVISWLVALSVMVTMVYIMALIWL